MCKIELKNIGYRIGNKNILKDINLTVRENERWIVLGLNGSGKTTLLSLLAGYRKTEMGSLYYNGVNCNEQVQKKLRRETGFISDSFFGAYFRNESALDIILSGKGGALGYDSTITVNDVAKAKNLLRYFDMVHKAQYPFELLSKGQQQIALICRGFMGERNFLFLDEPCNGLDILMREKVQHLLKEAVYREETGVVYVTHHLEEITTDFTHCLLLKNGQQFAVGTIEKILSNDTLSAFLGYQADCCWNDHKLNVKLDIQGVKKIELA
ncbi:MAG: ATP-binding cassette domain-containing protein [Peptococcaceae bacterium]|nr:ATP-binding cassette domain-containing protein [Peptococcaceae bacterium]